MDERLDLDQLQQDCTTLDIDASWIAGLEQHVFVSVRIGGGGVFHGAVENTGRDDAVRLLRLMKALPRLIELARIGQDGK